MKGLSQKSRDSIEETIDRLFDKMTYNLLGYVPKRGKKIYFFTEKPSVTLANLFVQAMRNRQPNEVEKEAAKGLFKTASKFIHSLKEKTATNVIDQLDARTKEASLGGKPVGLKEVKTILNKEMEKAKSHFKMISETEATKTRNTGATMDISKVGASLGVSDPNVFFIVNHTTACVHCVKNHLMPDGVTPRVFKLSEVKQSYLTKEERDAGSVSAAGLHPHCMCLYDSMARVVTERGHISIKNVKVGDRVLTHTGKFKNVIATFGENGIKDPDIGDVFTLKFKDPQNKTRTLRSTGDHLYLTNDGWVRADSLDLKKHKLQFLHKKCENCQEHMPHNVAKPDRRFCSNKCVHEDKNKNGLYAKSTGRKQSKEEIDKRIASIRTSKKEKIDKSGILLPKMHECKKCGSFFDRADAYYDSNNKLIKRSKVANYCSQSCRSKTIAEKQWSSEAHRANIVDKNKKAMLKSYEDGRRDPLIITKARKALFERKGPTKDQQKIFENIIDQYPDAVLEFKIDKFFADIAIPSVKTVIEWDGGGHWISVFSGKLTMEQKIKKDAERDSIMNSLGWHVIRYSPEVGYKNVLQDIRRVSLNSTSGYSFKNVDIVEIKKTDSKNKSRKARLYNISVEEDNSFVILGIVSHNCTLSILAPGFGFKGGKVDWVGLNHDEYAEQKKT